MGLVLGIDCDDLRQTGVSGSQVVVKLAGNGLGWGIGAAAGAKLADPDRQVVCSIGDGSVMYSA